MSKEDQPVDIAFHYVLQSYTGARSGLEAVERRIEFQLTFVVTITVFGIIAVMSIAGDSVQFGCWEIATLAITLIIAFLTAAAGFFARGKGKFRVVNPYLMMVDLKGLPDPSRRDAIEVAGRNLRYHLELISNKTQWAHYMLVGLGLEIVAGAAWATVIFA